MKRRFEVRVQLSEYWFAFLFFSGGWTVWVSWVAFGRFFFYVRADISLGGIFVAG